MSHHAETAVSTQLTRSFEDTQLFLNLAKGQIIYCPSIPRGCSLTVHQLTRGQKTRGWQLVSTMKELGLQQ